MPPIGSDLPGLGKAADGNSLAMHTAAGTSSALPHRCAAVANENVTKQTVPAIV